MDVVGIGMLAFVGSAAIGLLLGIAAPSVDDEFSYLLAADTFLHGRLTNPTHPMWVHFETPHVIHVPTYTSKFMPAQGLILALGRLVGGLPIVGVWLSVAFMCAAICWMLQAWVPRRWAMFGGLCAVIHPIIGISGYWAQSYWGGAVAAAGGALLLGGVRRFMRMPRTHYAVAAGIGLAVLANSRPYEGLLLSLSVAIAILMWIASKHRADLGVIIRRVLLPLGLMSALTLAGVAFYNYRVTGSIFQLPYLVHEKMYSVSPLFIWESLPPAPTYRHDVIRDFHAVFELPVYLEKRSFWGFISRNFAALMFFMFYGLGIFAIPLIGSFRTLLAWVWRSRWGRMALLVYLIFAMGIMVEIHNRLHYWAPVTALNYYFVIQSARLWRARDRRVGRFVTFLVPALALTALAILSYRSIGSQGELASHSQRAKLLARLINTNDSHLIVIKYGPNHSSLNEWIYNEADIDGSKVVWARAMDPKEDCNVVRYFRERKIWSLEIDNDEEPIQLKPFATQSCPQAEDTRAISQPVGSQ